MAYTSKFVSIFVLFISTFISGIIPYVIIRCINVSRRLEIWIGRLHCFVGGIFFGTALLTLLPEARELLNAALKDAKAQTEYPVAEVLAGIGFLLVLILEHFIGVCHRSNYSHSHSHGEDNEMLNSSKNEDKKVVFEYHKENSNSDIEENNKKGKIMVNEAEPLIDSFSEPNKEKEAENFTTIRTVFLLLALSFHMIFDGLAIGLQTTETKVYTLLGTLTLHKCIVAFSVGLHLSSTFDKFKKLVRYMFFFSLVSPSGTAIGLILTEYEGNQLAQDMTSGVLQSIACGTFLYITFFEILLKELSRKHNILNTLLTVTGFTVSAATNFFLSEH